MSEKLKVRYYSINGKRKYVISEKSIPDKDGMINAINFHTSKKELVKKSLLRSWKNTIGVTVLRGGRY